MKHLLLFFALFSVSVSLSAQDTIPRIDTVVTYYKEGKMNEKYSVNTSKEKDGKYMRYTKFGKPYISGQYAKGEPVGIWEYYSSDSSGVLVEKLDFNSHKELFVDPLRIPQIICGPRFFGGNMIKHEYIEGRVRKDFTAEEKKLYKGETYTVSFTVDSVSLKPVGITVDNQDLLEPIKAKLVAIVSEMPAWLPPACKGKEAVWRFSVGVTF